MSSGTVDDSSTFPLVIKNKTGVDPSDLINQPFIIQQYAWSSSSGASYTQFPQTVVETTALSFYNQILNMYSYSHTNWKIKFKINGTMFHAGKLIAFWVPAAGQSNLPFADVDSCLAFPHVMIDASSSGEYVLEIPKSFNYRSLVNKHSTTAGSLQGQLVIQPFMPLVYSTGATTTLNVVVWAVAEPILMAPCPLPASYSTIAVPHGGLANTVSKAGYSVVDTIVDAGKGIIGSIPLVGPLLASFLDRPPHKSETVVVRKFASPSTWGEGESACTTLSITPGLKHMPPVDIIGEPMTAKDILTIPRRVGSASTDVTTGGGALVKQIPVYLNSGDDVPYGTTDSAAVDFSPRGIVWVNHCAMNYLAACYKFWRGSIRFVFEFVCAPMVSQTYAVMWDPDRVSLPAALNYNAISGTASTYMIEVRGPTKQTITVPFAHNRPFRPTTHLSYNNLYAGTNDPGLESINGVLGVFAITAPNAPNNAPATVKMNIYMMPGDDFELLTPTGQEISNIIEFGSYYVPTLLGDAPPGAEPHGEEAPNPLPVKPDQEEVLDAPTEMDILPEYIMPAEAETEAKHILGEDAMDIYKLMKRFTPLLQAENGVSTSGGWFQIIIPVTPNLMPSDFPGNSSAVGTTIGIQSANFINYFAACARYWRGSFNYRVYFNSAIESVHAGFFPKDSSFGGDNFQNFKSVNVKYHASSDLTFANAVDYSWKRRSVMMRSIMGPSGMDLGHGESGTCMEFTVPYISQYDMMISDPTFLGLSGTGNWSDSKFVLWNPTSITGVLVIWARCKQVDSTTTTQILNPKLSVEVAAGDDFALFQATNLPRLNMLNLR